MTLWDNYEIKGKFHNNKYLLNFVIMDLNYFKGRGVVMELLSALCDVPGWDGLSEHQKNVLFLVYQDHSKMYQGARLDAMVRVCGDPYDEHQVHVYYQDEWFHYGIDTRSGRSIWY